MEFTWNICNVGMSTLHPSGYVESPAFTFMQHEFCLRLYPRVADFESTEAVLELIRTDEYPSNSNLEYLLQIFANDTERFLPVEELEVNDCIFSQKKSCKVRFTLKPDICLLTLSCFVCLNERRIDRDTEVPSYVRGCPLEDRDTENLSRTIESLLKDGAFSDFELQAGRDKFKVHKAILEARSKNLATNLRKYLSCHPCSADTIRHILAYVYSGKIRASDATKELISLLANVASDLLGGIARRCSSVSAKTMFQVTKFRIRWGISVEPNMSKENPVFYVKEGPQWSWLKLTLLADYPGGFVIRVERLQFDVDVIFRCELFCRNRPGRSNVRTTFGFLFRDQRDCEFPIKAAAVTNRPLYLELNLHISRGDHSGSITYITLENERSDHRIDGFADDIEGLIEHRNFSDITIKVGGKSFPVHKAILCAWSRVFRRMFSHDFKESKNSEIVIKDLDAETVDYLLRYMYGGKFFKVETGVALNVCGAADKYEIEGLARKCSEFVASRVAAENVCSILRFADSHCIESLKEAVCKFVYRNAKRVQNSEEWKELMRTHPDLASGVLEKVLRLCAEFSKD